jgi:integrase/recombinase XerC
MTSPNNADIEAARLLLSRLGISATDLLATTAPQSAVPTFAEYVPIVEAAVTAGTRRVYSSYWKRIVEHWSSRRLDEPTPTEIQHLAELIKPALTIRRNARGGRSATEHLIAALRCIYRHAENDGLVPPGTNPALKVAKPRRLTSTRQAIPDAQLAEINQIAATTGNDPALDTLILRLHTETACRRGGALALTPNDLDTTQSLVRLTEKGETEPPRV